jgi:hypothetical protein
MITATAETVHRNIRVESHGSGDVNVMAMKASTWTRARGGLSTTNAIAPGLRLMV